MSFALEVKEEIVQHSFSKKQKLAFISGFIQQNGEYQTLQNPKTLRLTTSSNKIARNLIIFIKEFFKGELNIAIIQPQYLKKQKIFQLTLTGGLLDVFFTLLNFDENDNWIISNELSDNSFNEDLDGILRAYIAGIFVASGSVNSPETSNYHLEIQFKSLLKAEYFVKLMTKFFFQFKILNRGNNRYIAYIKKSSSVSDFIKLIDASECVLDFENKRISRDMINNINRIQNIDISNQTKTLETSQKQIELINKIRKNGIFINLNNKVQTLCLLRLKYPDASYTELVQKMNKCGYNITKSGVSNIFKQIVKLNN